MHLYNPFQNSDLLHITACERLFKYLTKLINLNFFSERFYEVPNVIKHGKLHFYFSNNDFTAPKYFGFLTELGVFFAEVNIFYFIAIIMFCVKLNGFF